MSILKGRQTGELSDNILQLKLIEQLSITCTNWTYFTDKLENTKMKHY
jgi:hypothetical protein